MTRQIAAWILPLLIGAGCSVTSGNLGTDSTAATARAVERGGESAGTPTEPSPECAKATGLDRRDQVCHRWRCEERDARAAAPWRGDPKSCAAGELDTDAGERALRLINLHRFLAGVAPVVAEASWSGAAQECSLLAHANTKLSHTPAREWRCWSDVAALTSSISLIANRSIPLAIGAFMEDPGNELTMVHRRWLLSEDLARVGLGSTDRYACVVVDGAPLDPAAAPVASTLVAAVPARGWVAWPPDGAVPIDVFEAQQLDTIGWTVQSNGSDLASATVTVTDSGKALAVTVTPLEPMLGSRSAIRFVPHGWKARAGHAYAVSIRGPKAIDFIVEPVDCDL
jgi:hypothetical protein